MKTIISIVAASALLLTACSTPVHEKSVHNACSDDREQLLSLNEGQFDQDMAGGWRGIAAKPGCNLAAADLLRDYQKAHQQHSGLMYWHEAQLRAFEAQTAQAIALMARTYKPVEQDRAGWNLYVDATIAFLRKDRPGLDIARAKLAALTPPTGKDVPPLVNGFMEVHMANGETRKFLWPPNKDVVDGLANCFTKSYAEAYTNACQVSSK